MDKDTRDLNEKVDQLDEVLRKRIMDLEERLKRKAEVSKVDNIKNATPM